MGADDHPPSTGHRREDTRDPRHARERALKILFQADVRGVSPEVTLQRVEEDADARAMIDEVEDLADGTPLLPPIADEPGIEVERIEPKPGTRAGARGTGDATGARAGGAAGRGGSPGRAPRHTPGEAVDGFTRALVLGVHEHREAIDALIARYARRWQISRMPVVDRTVLRLATYELLHEPTPPAIVIDQAVALAKDLSTDDSGRYVNGVLEAVRRHLVEQATETDPADAVDTPDATDATDTVDTPDARDADAT